jgi:hypothetical protein
VHNNKHSLRSNTKGHGDKTHWTDSQNNNCAYWQRAVPFAVLAPGGQSGNVWTHSRVCLCVCIRLKIKQFINSMYIIMSSFLTSNLFNLLNFVGLSFSFLDYGLDDRGSFSGGGSDGIICFSSPPRPDRLWGPPSVLSNGYRG